ncbi:hypothetical protein A306_00000035 [Columba livia]|uniref:Uncharacterized protein n=1 Tax=Columba livia TaxID=8932 RepID=A0A2I0MQF2_COLLI|nr:hypothetical protein A306_00000035 [Columba livia]
MSGTGVGVLYTRNHEIRKAVNQLAVFHSCPGPGQCVLIQFLRHRDCLGNVNLEKHRIFLLMSLQMVEYPCSKVQVASVWVDFRKMFEAELELWQKLLDTKLLISSGKAFYYAFCNPEKDSSCKPANTPGNDVSQLKHILVY